MLSVFCCNDLEFLLFIIYLRNIVLKSQQFFKKCLMIKFLVASLYLPAYAQLNNVDSWSVFGQHIYGAYLRNEMICSEAWTGTDVNRWAQRLHTAPNIIQLEPGEEYVATFDVFGDSPAGLDSFPVVFKVSDDNWQTPWAQFNVSNGVKKSYEFEFTADSSAHSAGVYLWFANNHLNQRKPHTLCVSNISIKKKEPLCPDGSPLPKPRVNLNGEAGNTCIWGVGYSLNSAQVSCIADLEWTLDGIVKASVPTIGQKKILYHSQSQMYSVKSCLKIRYKNGETYEECGSNGEGKNVFIPSC